MTRPEKPKDDRKRETDDAVRDWLKEHGIDPSELKPRDEKP